MPTPPQFLKDRKTDHGVNNVRNAEKRGAVIDAGDVEAAWIAVLALMHTRLLALLDRLVPQLHAEDGPAGMRDVLRGASGAALEELPETDVGPDRD